MDKNIRLILILVFCIALSFWLFQDNIKVKPGDLSKMSTDELIRLLNDPADPENLFYEITVELGRRGEDASEAAPSLANALAYPRRDSYFAAYALIRIGPNASAAVPILYSELMDSREDVRRYAALSLGAIGSPAASCAVPSIAELLWHEDPSVRSSAAISLDALTGADLVEEEDKLNSEDLGAIQLDLPEGDFVRLSREWWLNSGMKTFWPIGECRTLLNK